MEMKSNVHRFCKLLHFAFLHFKDILEGVWMEL